MQFDRLYSLVSRGHQEDRIYLPEFVLREVLAQGNRKKKSSPGSDALTWDAPGHLPNKAVLLLRSLFEARINSDPGHDSIIEAWCSTIVHLIPKRKDPSEI